MSFIPLSKADMDKLEKERKEIERRRNAEAKRAKYFFNEKQRGMGIDVDFIKTQITEKAATKKEEKNKDVSYEKEIESFVDRLADLDEKRQIFGKEKAFKVGEHQRMSKMEDRDTFYLNDPLMIKKDLPPRMNDAQYIPSCCLQKFDGEDLSKSQRVKKQQKEIENWSKQIIDEKKKNEQNEQEMTQKYIQQRNAHFEQLNAVQMAKEKAMKMKKVQIANANLAKMQQTEHKKEENKATDLRKSVSEINKMKESAFLNEAWSSTLRNDNNDRFIPYNFKGFSQNQRQKILNQQSEQIQQHLEDKNDEKKKNEEFKRFFGTNKNKNKNAAPQPTLHDVSENMDKRMDHLDTKINRLDSQILALKKKMNRSKGNTRKNYQMKALKLLKQKKQYEQQRDRTMGQQMNIENAKFATESVADNVQMMSAMKGANAALKKQFKEINIDDVDDVMDDMGELMDETNEINEIMSEQWNGDDYDEDELLDELDGFDDELDDLDEMEEDKAPSYLTSANAAQNKQEANPEKEVAANQMAKIQMKN